MSRTTCEFEEQMMAQLACGRTFYEQVEFVKRFGNHGVPAVLRQGLFRALNMPLPKRQAKNAVIFGCYVPFSNPFFVCDTLRLLGRLGIDYTYLDQDYCCGSILKTLTPKEEKDATSVSCREINQGNIEQARQKGADTLAYCCVGCAHTTKSIFPEADDRHVYILDLMMDALETQRLEGDPMSSGYFEGCHTVYRTNFPQVRLDWERYRRLLGNIRGLEIVDLPNNLCCKRNPDKIQERAAQLKLDTLICSCNGCLQFLGDIFREKVHMMSFPEVVLKALSER